MLKRLSNGWKALIFWFEYGDLVPLIVIVSSIHYSQILSEHDPFIVATAIGLMVDLGHYRTVRAAVRYNGTSDRTRAIRWSMAIFMTVVSVVYQQRFYQDWWLSLPLPFLIIALAWLQQTDKSLQAKAPAKESKSPAKVSKVPAKTYVAVCDLCEWSRNGYKSERAAINGKNAHMRTHIGV